jgi:hypothetical protein
MSVMPKPVARITSPAQMVASLPLWMGYVPSESLVVVCCHEPRGRMGLTMRFDLPGAGHESALVGDVVRRVRHEKATRVLLAVYTAEEDGPSGSRPRTQMVDDLRSQLDDLVVTEVALVRGERFWSYLCDQPSCCPPEGTPVDTARESAPIRLLEAENVFSGRTLLPDRRALEATLAPPTFLLAEVARQRCEIAATLLADAVAEAGFEVAAAASLSSWAEAIDRFRSPPSRLSDMEAAALAISLVDVSVRDTLAASSTKDLPALLLLLEELCRRTPDPYDAPVCTLFGWLTYCQGGGALVTIALVRALASDPSYSMAHLLEQALLAQVRPKELRRLTRNSLRLAQRRTG